MQDISKIMCVIDIDSEAQPALQRGALLAKQLGDTKQLGCWRATAVECLHIWRFRREMRASLQQKAAKPTNIKAATT